MVRHINNDYMVGVLELSKLKSHEKPLVFPSAFQILDHTKQQTWTLYTALFLNTTWTHLAVTFHTQTGKYSSSSSSSSSSTTTKEYTVILILMTHFFSTLQPVI